MIQLYVYSLKETQKKPHKTMLPKSEIFAEQDTFFVTRHGIISNDKRTVI